MEVILGLSLHTEFHNEDTEQLVVTIKYSRNDTTPCIQTEVRVPRLSLYDHGPLAVTKDCPLFYLDNFRLYPTSSSQK